MTAWKAGYPVEYSAASEENIDSWAQKYIAEIDRIYSLLHRIRQNDMASGEPNDTVAYQWHFDYDTKTLKLRNSADDGWIDVGRFTADEGGFYFIGAITDVGGATAIGVGATKPEMPAEKTLFFDTVENKTFYYVDGNWKQVSGDAIYKDDEGKIIGDLKGNADSASKAIEATHAAVADFTERATTADRFTQTVKINGVPFDGSKSISIVVSEDEQEKLYGSFSSRLEQAERELANIEAALVDYQIYPDYNNLLVENFSNGQAEEADRLKVMITSMAVGDDSVNVDSLENVKVGAVYTLTDYEQQEEVRIKGVIKNGDTNRAIFEAPMKNMYRTIPSLYRTTSAIGDGGAYGTASVKVVSYENRDIWYGYGSATKIEGNLNTTQSNAGAFTTSGSIMYSATGFVTLL